MVICVTIGVVKKIEITKLNIANKSMKQHGATRMTVWRYQFFYDTDGMTIKAAALVSVDASAKLDHWEFGRCFFVSVLL